jgi:hypothetical protein
MRVHHSARPIDSRLRGSSAQEPDGRQFERPRRRPGVHELAALRDGQSQSKCAGRRDAGESFHFNTIPSRPILEDAQNTVEPSASMYLLSRRSGRGLLQQQRQCGLASVERPAPQVAAVEPDQFGSLSLVVRVEPPIVRVGQGLLRLAALVPSGSIGVGTGDPVE